MSWLAATTKTDVFDQSYNNWIRMKLQKTINVLIIRTFQEKRGCHPKLFGKQKTMECFLRQIKENSWSQISFINFGANLLSCQTENNFYCLFKLGVLFGSAFHSIINKIYARSIKLYLRIKINSTCKSLLS